MAIDRVFSQPVPDEDGFMLSLRPRSLDEYVGQPALREQLLISLEAARQRREPLDHLLLDGPPGLGKTTLAHIIAHEMNATIRVTSGPAVGRQGDVMALLTQMETGDILFIDEIHRLSPVVEEFLYPAIEDFRVDFTPESGIGGRTVNFALPRFTLIGATTRAGMLSAPLRGRFGQVLHLRFYPAEELMLIAERSAARLRVSADADALQCLAQRSRGTPRIVNRLLRRVRDYAQVRGDGRLTARIVDAALDILQIDALGLDVLDREYLHVLIRHYDGGPAGIEAIAAAMGHERDTLEDVVEPFLLQRNFVVRTPRGRVIRPDAYAHLGLAPPPRATAEPAPPGLFEV